MNSEKDGGRVQQLAKRAVAGVLMLGFVAGIPAWTIYHSWGEPLYQAKTVTVTKTVHTGLLVEAVPTLFVWFLIVFIFFAMATGVIPQPPRVR